MEIVSTEFKKVSMKDERLTIDANLEFKLPDKEETFFRDINSKCPQIVDKDLKAAFDKLKSHVVCICEQPEMADIFKNGLYAVGYSLLEHYVITGYTISGSDENAGVTIVAQKLLKTGQVLNLVAPMTKFEDTEAYKFCNELLLDIEGCNYEVEQYMLHGKWGIKQAEFDFEPPEESNFEEQPQAQMRVEKSDKNKALAS